MCFDEEKLIVALHFSSEEHTHAAVETDSRKWLNIITTEIGESTPDVV